MSEESALIFAVADGAGSAAFSAAGSKLAVSKFLSEASNLNVAPADVTREHVAEIVEKIRAALLTEADNLQCDLRELSTTLLGGCVSNKSSWFCQVGDGAIVAKSEGIYRAVTWPSNGEYVNMTTFVTSDSWLAHLQFESIPTAVEAFAAFTDGLQELILVHSDRSVHAKFFDPIFAALQKASEESDLSLPLRSFLSSKSVNERTDDDKSLVLGWRNDTPAAWPS